MRVHCTLLQLFGFSPLPKKSLDFPLLSGQEKSQNDTKKCTFECNLFAKCENCLVLSFQQGVKKR